MWSSNICGLRLPAKRFDGSVGQGMFTKEILFGMNLLTLAGFVVMGAGLTLNRQGTVRTPVAFAVMGTGTVLVFLGLYLAAPATP
jgi:hypothetical protein